jgi:hypothetical protein
MSLIVRLVLAMILVGGPAIWFSMTVTEAAAQPSTVTEVRGPLTDINDNDPDEVCRSGNPRKQKKCHYNGWESRVNNNDNGSTVLASDSSVPLQAAVASVDGLTLELSRTAEPPAMNSPFVVSLKGDGASIERVWWWTEGPVQSGPFVDDLAMLGEQSYSCSGAQPCSWSWPVVARYLGPYTLHAKVRDTAGREVQADWKFDTIEQPKP